MTQLAIVRADEKDGARGVELRAIIGAVDGAIVIVAFDVAHSGCR